MVPGFHGLDLIVILVIALLIFGPKKLPEMGSAIGKSIKEFQKGMRELSAPKDEHEEESKLPVSAQDISKVGANATESEANLKTTPTSETSNAETKID
jgi:sec-independent protein translocase protein TatA